MKISTLKEAMHEARRFLVAGQALVKAEEAKSEYRFSNPKESGAVSRASMDLTRKLADLRQGR